MTTVRLAPDGSVLDRAETPLPRRFRLAAPAVRRLADLAGTVLPWPESGEPTGDDEPLRLAGLVDHTGAVLTEARAAMARLQTAEVLLDLDLAVHRPAVPGGSVRLRSWQRLAGSQVTSLSTALGPAVELAWFGVDRWQGELARVAGVTMPAHAPQPPADRLDLPYDLLLGSGAAWRDHRLDVFDELVSRDADEVRVGGRRVDRASAADQLRRLHGHPVGRLQAVVSGRSRAGRRRCGWLSWLLFADGWRELAPYSADGHARVRLDVRTAPDLGVAIASLVTEVRS